MKLSTVLFLTDILPHRRRMYNKIVKNKIFLKHTAPEVFTALKKIGFEGIELMLPQFTKARDEDLQEVKQILDTHKMPVLSVHQKLRFFTKTNIDEIFELFRVAKIFGAKVIVLHMNTVGKQIFSKEYVDTIHSLQKETGIKVGFENMEKFFGSLHRKYSWHEGEFAKLMQDSDFLITFDIQHLAHSGGDILKFFVDNKDRIINVHLSDYRGSIFNTNLRPLRFKHLPLGKGTLPIEQFVKMLKAKQYEGLVTLEIHTDLKGICESAQIINAALKGKQ
ncbi:MAG TPA: sugar phosphate isomerase/epimerase [Patescibacteria group bacterium]